MLRVGQDKRALAYVTKAKTAVDQEIADQRRIKMFYNWDDFAEYCLGVCTVR